jgi:hypothetical protein
MDTPIVMVAGMPRTGSMWTYNVARRLIRLAGYTPWPVHIPPDPIPSFRLAIQQGVAANDLICIKVHARFEGALPGLKILCNVRDARDALLSYMRFTRCDFESAIEGFSESLALADYYLGESRFDVLDVRYENIMQRPAETITHIAAFIGYPVSAEQAALIASEYARENVRNYVAKLGDIELDGGERFLGSAQFNADGSVRGYDEVTGFQGGHVSDSVGGEWRTLLTPGQQARLSELTRDWLARHGYAE